MTGLDFAIVGLTLAASLGVGVALGRRGRTDLVSFFAAGRQLPWWIAGTSMVATSFAADTPLAIARIVRTQGLVGNWYWWSGAIGFCVCMFLFAPLWRRARLLTDAEVIELRYGGREATGLRAFLAIYRGLLSNGITLGWVLLGMQKIAGETLGWPRVPTLIGLVTLSLVYTAASGLWGVVMTDLLQFGLAMLGSIVLMIYAYDAVGGPSELAEKVSAIAGQGALDIIPDATASSAVMATFAFYFGLQWIAGAEGGGFLAQRLFATRNERHAVLSLLWFSVAHFALRAWPWIVVGLASVVLLPNLADPETAYPRMMVELLPAGWLGLMVASLLAAFMSTVSTHLHWGASYLVNDLYKRLLRPNCSDKHAVKAGQFAAIGMAGIALVMAFNMDSVFGAWLYLSEIGAGAVVAGILRWYWWRMSARAEIAALAVSLLLSNALRWVPALAGDAMYPARFAVVLLAGTSTAVAVAWLSGPAPQARLRTFYERVQPGFGWGPIARLCPNVRALTVSWAHLRAIGLAVLVVYSGLFGLGGLALGRWLQGVAVLTIGVVALWRLLPLVDRTLGDDAARAAALEAAPRGPVG